MSNIITKQLGVKMSVNVLIIGYGYLGKALGKLLHTHHHQIFAIKRKATIDDQHIQFIYKDIHHLTTADLPNSDYVIYCPSADKRDQKSYDYTYLQGVTHILKLYETKEQKPGKFIFISSTSVYETQDGSWVDENTPCDPVSATAKILLQAEKVVSESELETTIIRFSGIYGPGRTHLMDQIRQKNFHLCFDTRFSNRIHIIDCARMIYHVMHLKVNQNLYIGTDCEPTPINTISAWLSSHMGIQLPEDKHRKNEDIQEHKSNKQLSNEKILHTGFRFEFENFHRGFRFILFNMER